ncbi:hypothetical protein IVB69_09985 [Flavobacterium sp. J49]|uniref:hypothetical protein n=1 Tax=Flavobacterium sp. J49 TaxID=2718534 RepID=UPI001593F531|nr:hypothetical protein [Flavobacterium sp. J49]MBF6641807.1 hypothetical protein [Flavobacterium sp. J49]NIC03054.1 hypothetical protein [Flavobacterium sp. J49]
MKHIKKKYLFQMEGANKLKEIGEEVSINDGNLFKKAKQKDLFVTTEKNFIIKAFPYKHSNGIAFIPIPDLTLVYYDSAYNQNKERKEFEVKLLEKLTSKNDKFGEDATNDIYHYYGNASGCIIFLFTALESFINHILPDDKSYSLETDRNTAYYNKKQIQRHIAFDDKLKKVLPQLLNGANFFSRQTIHTQHITNLKKLRDELIHTKSDISFVNQEELIKRLLQFKYDETFTAVAMFMNFYKPDYVVDCDCNLDF